MAHIVPSQAHALINKLYPWAAEERVNMDAVQLRTHDLHAMLNLLERIPDSLIRLSGDDFISYCVNVAMLRGAWENRPPGGAHIALRSLSRENHTPIHNILHLLAKCPDEDAAETVTKLAFVTDTDLRDDLRRDITSAESALMSYHYKAATVLGGSVVEALLLWGLTEFGEANVRAATRAPPEALNRWSLGQMIPAARDCQLIADDTKKQAELAQNYRNLIHPGRAARLGDKCDRGTALGVMAGVERVAVDLERSFP